MEMQTFNGAGLEPAGPTESLAAESMLTVISRALVGGQVSKEVVQFLLEERRRELDREREFEARQRFDAAKAAAMAEMPLIGRSRTNTQTNKNYAAWDDVARVVNPVLGRHGLSLDFEWADEPDDRIRVTAILSGFGHEVRRSFHSDRWEGVKNRAGEDVVNSVQKIGGSQTYLMRYAARLVVPFSYAEGTEDDDGRSFGKAAQLSVDQYRILSDLIADTGANEAVFLGMFGVSDLHELPVKRFSEALKLLRKKKESAGNA
ncbi:MAG: ERF family protein [Pseudomonadota bacterium]